MFGLDVQSVQVGKGGTRHFFLVLRISELLTTFFHSFVILCTRNCMVPRSGCSNDAIGAAYSQGFNNRPQPRISLKTLKFEN
jgi:hypothetical protein